MNVRSVARGFPASLQNFMVLTFVLILIEQIWAFVTLYSTTRNGWFESLIHTVPVGCSALLVRLVGNQHQPEQRKAWHILSWALISWTCGQIVYFSFLFGFKIQAFPSVADVFYTLAPILMLIGYFSLPHKILPTLESWRAALGAVIIVLTVLSYAWFFVLAPAIIFHTEKNHIGLGILLAMSYPIYDILILAILVTNIATLTASSFRIEMHWVIFQLIGWTVADGYFLARCFITTLPEAHPLEVGWAWGAYCIALASKASLQNKSLTNLPFRIRRFVMYYGAYIAIIFMFPLLIYAQNTPSLLKFGVDIGTLLIVLAIIVRQSILTDALEKSNTALQKLSNELEARVQERTEALEFQALHDALTGLPNRVFAERHLIQILENPQARATAVLYIDLDHFKDINDTLGHPTGDEVLRLVTQRFQSFTPKEGFLARLGGDEFIMVLPNLEPLNAQHQAERIAEDIVHSLSSALRVGDADFFLGASVGISFSPFDGTDAITLQKHADSAMYQAKREGLGFRVYSPDLDASAIERLETERALRRALETDPGSVFELHYQPILELQTGQIVALEALVRWNEHTMRSPAQFIPIAEECGLIVPLGTWVLGEACRQMAVWESFKLRVSVNVSTVQFERPDFVDVVKRILEKTKLEPDRLSLELLEGVLVSRFDETASKIAQLRALGVRLALDDFGSGYSSLSYLNRLTFDTLKLDRSFINSLGRTRDTYALVAAILSIANEFGMESIAEGVETLAQLETLKALGCDNAQGWLYAPAMPAAEVEALLRGGKLEVREITTS